MSSARRGRTLTANFHDVTGVKTSSQVKFAGANAGVVTAVRMLTPQERSASGDPLNAVRITIALNADVPELPADVKPSVAADTLLSDKFVLLSGGTAASGVLKPGTVLQGITPTTFDKLVRETNGAIEDVRKTLGGETGQGASSLIAQAGDILKQTQALLAQAGPVLNDAKPVIADAHSLVGETRSVVGDAKSLIDENRQPLTNAIQKLSAAADKLQKLADNGNSLLQNNDKNLTSAISDLKVTAENLKLTSTYTSIFFRALNQRPTMLIWGGRPLVLPSEKDILQSHQPAQ